MKILVIRMRNHPRYPFPYLSLLSLLSQPSNSHCQCTASKTLFPNIKEKQFLARLECGSKQCSLIVLPIHYSTGVLKILSVLINFPLITLSLMNLLVQTSSHSPKNYGRDMQAGLMAIPHQARK